MMKKLLIILLGFASLALSVLAWADPITVTTVTTLPSTGTGYATYPLAFKLHHSYGAPPFVLNFYPPTLNPGSGATVSMTAPTSSNDSDTCKGQTLTTEPCTYTLPLGADVTITGTFAASAAAKYDFNLAVPYNGYQVNLRAQTTIPAIPALLIESSGSSESIVAYVNESRFGTGSLTVKNIGGITLTNLQLAPVTGLVMTDPNSCAASLAPGASCTLTLTYTPVPGQLHQQAGGLQPATIAISSAQGASDAIVINLTAADTQQLISIPDSLSTYHGLPWLYGVVATTKAFTVKEQGQQVLYVTSAYNAILSPTALNLYRSTDGGVTWNQAVTTGLENFSALFINALQIDSHGTLYLAGAGYTFWAGRVYSVVEKFDVTTNSWDDLTFNLNDDSSVVTSLVISGDTLYVAGVDRVEGGSFVRELNNQVWNDVTTALPPGEELSSMIEANGRFYIGGYIAGNGRYRAGSVPFVKTWASGETGWTDVEDGNGLPTSGSINTLLYANSKLFAGGIDSHSDLPLVMQVNLSNPTAWASVNNFPSLENVAGSAVNTLMDVDGTLYAGGDQSGYDFGFVLETPDNGDGTAQWTDPTNGFFTNAYLTMNSLLAINNGTSTPGIMAVGGTKNGQQGYTVPLVDLLTNEGAGVYTWVPQGAADLPAFSKITHVVTDNAGNLYAAGGYYNISNSWQPLVFKLPAEQAAWQDMNSDTLSAPVSVNRQVDALSVSADGSRIFAGVNNYSANPPSSSTVEPGYVNQWNGTSWSAVDSADFSGLTVMALADSGTTIYAGGQNPNSSSPSYVYEIMNTDAGPWIDISSSLPSTGSPGIVDSLAYDSGSLYAGGGYGQAGSHNPLLRSIYVYNFVFRYRTTAHPSLWETITPFPGATNGEYFTLMINSLGLFAGGESASSAPLFQATANPASNLPSWNNLWNGSNMNVPTQGSIFTSTMVTHGSDSPMLVAGGNNSADSTPLLAGTTDYADSSGWITTMVEAPTDFGFATPQSISALSTFNGKLYVAYADNPATLLTIPIMVATPTFGSNSVLRK